MHVRKDDLVMVISGDDADNRPRKVLRVLPDHNQVVVEGVNQVKKHVKPSKRHPRGGQLNKEMPMAASKVLLWCNKCTRGVRIGRRLATDGTKERYCKKCGTGLGRIGKTSTVLNS